MKNFLSIATIKIIKYAIVVLLASLAWYVRSVIFFYIPVLILMIGFLFYFETIVEGITHKEQKYKNEL